MGVQEIASPDFRIARLWRKTHLAKEKSVEKTKSRD